MTIQRPNRGEIGTKNMGVSTPLKKWVITLAMDTISRIIGGFTTWWIVATFTMWVFAGFAIHFEIERRRNRVFFYIVLAIAIIGFIIESNLNW